VRAETVGRAAAAAVLLGLGLGVAGCRENLAAPGACPEYCPPDPITVVDSVLRQVVAEDSMFRGYVPAHAAEAMQLVRPGGGVVSYGVVRFEQFDDSLPVPGIVGVRKVVGVDSFRVRITVSRRAPPDSAVELGLHRLPATLDSLSTLSDVAPFFDDSTLIAILPVPDTVEGDTLALVLGVDAFPTFMADSLRAALGIALRTPGEGYLDLRTRESEAAALLTAFVQVDSGGGATYARSDQRAAELDTYVFSGIPPVPQSAVAVGGVPAARTFIRFALPDAIVDSADVVRATLVLVPAGAATGAPTDTFVVRADGLGADFGPKSPFDENQAGGSVRIAVGGTDTVRLDVTNIMRPWRGDTLLPRVVMLRAVREGATLGELRFFSADSSAAAPSLHVTYVPFVRRGS
jgi:hypothetical protein